MADAAMHTIDSIKHSGATVRGPRCSLQSLQSRVRIPQTRPIHSDFVSSTSVTSVRSLSFVTRISNGICGRERVERLHVSRGHLVLQEQDTLVTRSLSSLSRGLASK